MNEGNALTSLAGLGVDPRGNLEEAVRLWARARGGIGFAEVDYARCLANEGVARQDLARLGCDPRENLEESVRLCARAREGLDPAGPGFALSLVNEGLARWGLAGLGVDPRVNLEEAVRLCARAREGLDPAGPDFARSLVNEGVARRELAGLGVEPRGNLEEAVRLFARARDGLDPAGSDFARCLMNEGAVREGLAQSGVHPQENLEEAVRLYARARDGFEATGPSFARCLMNEGNSRQLLAGLGVERRGNLEEAARLYARARDGHEAAGPEFARCLANEGVARHSLAQLGSDPQLNRETALRLEGLAGERFLSLGHHADAVNAYSNQGAFARHQAEEFLKAEDEAARWAAWRQSLDAFSRAIAALEMVRSEIASRRDRRDWIDRNARLYLGAVEACLELDESEAALEFAERGRGRTLIDLLNLRENRPHGIDDETWSDYQKIIRRLEALEEPGEGNGQAHRPNPGERTGAVASSSRGPSAGHGERFQLRALLRVFEDRFRASDPDYFAVAQPPNVSAIREVARSLGRTLVLPWIGERRSCAFLVYPDSRVESVDLPDLSEGVVREWMFGPGGRPGPTGWIGTYYLDRRTWLGSMAARLAEVHRLLIAPIDAALGGDGRPTRVAIVAGGLLSLLPLHAASPESDKAGSDSPRCWLDRVEVIHGPSVLVLGRCGARERPIWSPVLGVIDTDSKRPLRFSRWEGVALGDRVLKAKGRYTPLVELKATLEAVRGPLVDHGIVHFSCHGFWDPGDPLVSGIVLADGRLTLRELLGERRCDASRLVTLSACESALGHEPGRRGDDYLGLPAGFLLAGARAVVGSLWSVSDPITALLMDNFYESLFQGMGLAASLRKAQLELRGLSKADAIERLREVGTPPEWLDGVRQFLDTIDRSDLLDHPYFWAGFAAYGAPEPVIDVGPATAGPQGGRR
jgi:CHAT domain-containing protein/tetratricopeptide (TPR) repeat protein